MPDLEQRVDGFFWLHGFEGVNVHDDRRAIGDQETAWLENLIPLGDGNARAVYDAGTILYIAPGTLTIVYDFPFNINKTFYHAVFLSDGSAVAVATANGNVTTMAAAATFTLSAGLPYCVQWGNAGILIIVPAGSGGGYYAWDGAFYGPSGTAPAWLSGLAANITTTGATNQTTPSTSATVTITQANPGVISWTANALANGAPFYLTTTGTLPAPLVANQIYFATSAATNTIEAALTPGGAAIATTTAGSGTHTATSIADNEITNVANTSGIVAGMGISGSGIQNGTLITAISPSPAGTITLSLPTTSASNSVNLTINWTMPTGLVGTAIETYQSRVWIVNGANVVFSAPGNGANFATSQGGGAFTSSDGFLKTGFLNVKQSNGFLYLFGDGSINCVSGVQTSGTPSTTTFNNQNVDPQTGLGWRDAITAFGRALCFANPTGVYALYGGAAEKISDKIDGLFINSNFTTVTPSMFTTTIFANRCLGIIMNAEDPTTNTFRTIMALWNGKKWFIGSQGLAVIFGTTLEQNAIPQGWGNDGKNLYQLFAVESFTLTKKVATKLWQSRKTPFTRITNKDIFVESAVFFGETTGVMWNATVDSDINPSEAFVFQGGPIIFQGNAGSGLQTLQFVNSLNQPINFIGYPPGVRGMTGGQAGFRLGMTATTQSPDFTLIGIGMTYNDERLEGR